MAWTAPKTFSAGSVLTAAELNTHLRDNMLETSAATVTTAGDFAYADAANSMGSRLAIGAANTHLVSDGTDPVWGAIGTDTDSAQATWTNGSYLKLDALTGGTPLGGSVEVAVTTGTQALVLWKARLETSAAGSITSMSYSVSGASTISAGDTQAIWYESSGNGDVANFGGFDLVTVTAGANTFALEAKVNGGTGSLQHAEIIVVGF